MSLELGFRLKILFLTDNFPPETNAPATRTYEHAVRWVGAGHQVTVITGAPNFPEGKLFPGYRNRWYSVEDMDGIRVVPVRKDGEVVFEDSYNLNPLVNAFCLGIAPKDRIFLAKRQTSSRITHHPPIHHHAAVRQRPHEVYGRFAGPH